MYMTLDISDWKLKVLEKRKLKSVRYFWIWKHELGNNGTFITALLLHRTPSFLSVLDNSRLILPSTLFQVLLTFLKLCLLIFHSWCFLPLLKLWKPRSIENGAAISESSESAFVSMQRCTQRDSLHKGKLTLSRQKDPKNGKLHSRTIYLGEKQSFRSSDITDSSIGLLVRKELSGLKTLSKG